MSTHESDGSSVCIHSVCVAAPLRRKGIAQSLLAEYLKRISAGTGGQGIERALLIAHRELVGLYEKAGFKEVGLSGVSHGSQPWFECVWEVPASTEVRVSPTPPIVVAQAPEIRNPGLAYSAFTHEQLIKAGEKQGERVNSGSI